MKQEIIPPPSDGDSVTGPPPFKRPKLQQGCDLYDQGEDYSADREMDYHGGRDILPDGGLTAADLFGTPASMLTQGHIWLNERAFRYVEAQRKGGSQSWYIDADPVNAIKVLDDVITNTYVPKEATTGVGQAENQREEAQVQY